MGSLQHSAEAASAAALSQLEAKLEAAWGPETHHPVVPTTLVTRLAEIRSVLLPHDSLTVLILSPPNLSSNPANYA